MPLVQLVKETGLSRRALIDLRAGRSRPHLKNVEAIKAALVTMGGLGNGLAVMQHVNLAQHVNLFVEVGHDLISSVK